VVVITVPPTGSGSFPARIASESRFFCRFCLRGQTTTSWIANARRSSSVPNFGLCIMASKEIRYERYRNPYGRHFLPKSLKKEMFYASDKCRRCFRLTTWSKRIKNTISCFNIMRKSALRPTDDDLSIVMLGDDQSKPATLLTRGLLNLALLSCRWSWTTRGSTKHKCASFRAKSLLKCPEKQISSSTAMTSISDWLHRFCKSAIFKLF